MSRRANILLVLALAVGLAYGRFVVPWILVEPAKQQEPAEYLVTQKSIEDKAQAMIRMRLLRKLMVEVARSDREYSRSLGW